MTQNVGFLFACLDGSGPDASDPLNRRMSILARHHEELGRHHTRATETPTAMNHDGASFSQVTQEPWSYHPPCCFERWPWDAHVNDRSVVPREASISHSVG